jgi:membrane fusion protein (multidrug efflux system)
MLTTSHPFLLIKANTAATNRLVRNSLTLALATLVVACGQGNTPAVGPGAAGGMPPPAEVGVITVKLTNVGLVTELPGRLEASRVAQVRARAAGIVQKRLFIEGSQVRAGQALFQIDASAYQATLASALASVAKAEANQMQASAQAERFKPLIEAKAISQQEFVNAQAAQKLAEADVAVARAAVQSARINLGYAAITAPIGGRIGRALVTEGALVGQGEATPMAMIQQIDPMYVNFTQSALEVMQLRRQLESGQLKRSGSQATSVRLVLEDGSEYAKPGKLLFSDLTVDSTSGQITLRAEVPNPAGILLPGLFVRVRLERAQAASAITLPQQAVTRSPQGDSVMVVASDGKVAPRPVKVGAQQGGQWVILDGLQSGDQVMVDGFQKLRGGAPVKPVPWQAPGSAPTKAANAVSAPLASASAAR